MPACSPTPPGRIRSSAHPLRVLGSGPLPPAIRAPQRLPPQSPPGRKRDLRTAVFPPFTLDGLLCLGTAELEDQRQEFSAAESLPGDVAHRTVSSRGFRSCGPSSPHGLFKLKEGRKLQILKALWRRHDRKHETRTMHVRHCQERWHPWCQQIPKNSNKKRVQQHSHASRDRREDNCFWAQTTLRLSALGGHEQFWS